jgi:hypothetical protein
MGVSIPSFISKVVSEVLILINQWGPVGGPTGTDRGLVALPRAGVRVGVVGVWVQCRLDK